MKSLLLSRSCVKPLRFPHFEFFKFNNPMNPGNEQRRDQYEAVNASKIRLPGKAFVVCWFQIPSLEDLVR